MTKKTKIIAWLTHKKHILYILTIIPIIPLLYMNTSYASATTETKLDNGLKIIVRENHRAPVIISQIWYKVGSSYEYNGITGISHMLEHMMFKSTKNLKDGEFSEIIAQKGGQQNAFTSQDYTAYYQLLNKDYLETSFKLESDRMQNLVLDPEVFTKEQQVVIEERRMRVEDNPISNTYERLLAAAHINSPYHNPVIGWPSDLQNYKVDDLRSWYEQWYTPNNATIVVVGDVQPEQVFSLAKKYFGDIQPRQLPEVKPRTQVPPLGERTINVNLPAKLPILFLTYNTPSYKTAQNNQAILNDIYTLEVISSLLTGTKSARFNKKLERDKELVTSIGTSYDSFSLYDNIFSINAIPAQNVSIEQIKTEILKEIELLKTTLVEQPELDRIKANLIANKTYEQDSLYYQAMSIGMLESIDLSWQDYDYYIEQLKKVQPAQIQATAQKYFTNNTLTTAVLNPKEL